MSDHPYRRRLHALLGVFLVGVAGSAVALLGGNLLDRPLLVGQVLLVGLAGACDLLAAADRRVTTALAWYRWSGLGKVLLGISLPLGFVGSADEVFFLLVTGVGGVSLAAFGVDMLAFHGRYTQRTRFDADSN